MGNRFLGMMSESSLGVQNPSSGYKITDIPFERLIPNEKNFYNVDDVSDIEEDIEQYGLKQPLEVFRLGESDSYKLIGGHRRFKAITNIRQRNPEAFSVIPCLVTRVRDELEEKLRLIQSNATSRELTDYEKMMQSQALKDIYSEMERRGYKLSGRKRELIAETLNVSATAVGKYDNIAANASDEVMESFRKDEISTNLAYNVSQESDEVQREFAHAPVKSTETLNRIKSEKKAAAPKKSPKSDDDYPDTVIRQRDIEEMTNMLMEIGDFIDGDNLILSGKRGVEIGRSVKMLLRQVVKLRDSLCDDGDE